MRTLASFLVVSADGYHVGANEEFDWPIVDQEFNQFAIEQLDASGLLIFGRATYEGMASYWPTPEAQQDDPAVASRMNSFPKIVVSRTLGRPNWANTRRVGGDVADELTRLKRQPGNDLLILGSSALTTSLMEVGVLDELRTMVSPVILGSGKSVFRTVGGRIGLRLLSTRAAQDAIRCRARGLDRYATGTNANCSPAEPGASVQRQGLS